VTPELRARVIESLSALARARLSEEPDERLESFALAEGFNLDGLTEETMAAFRGPSCECDSLRARLEQEALAKAALHATCERLLSEVATRDVRISRQQQDLDLSGRAVERALEALHSTTLREPPPSRTEVVGDAVVHR
jgi:hypothetical protein